MNIPEGTIGSQKGGYMQSWMQVTAQHNTASPFTKVQAQTASPAATADDSTTSSSTSSSSSTSEATITANDFLTLLVSEMKNQDPTSSQDPNEYINQLVQVNSLEQLIQINTDLGGSSTSSTTSSTDSTQGGSSSAAAAISPAGKTDAASVMRGNLSSGGTTTDAKRVSTALSSPAQSLGTHAAASTAGAELPTSASDLRAYILQKLHQ